MWKYKVSKNDYLRIKQKGGFVDSCKECTCSYETTSAGQKCGCKGHGHNSRISELENMSLTSELGTMINEKALYGIMNSFLGKVTQIACGARHALVLLYGGYVKAWKYDDSEVVLATNIPESIQGKVTQIACGEYHSLALLNDGTVKGWGDDKMDPSIHIPQEKLITQITCSYITPMVLSQDGTVITWRKRTVDEKTYLRRDIGGNVAQIASGVYYSMVLLDDGTVRVLDNKTGEITMPNLGRKQVLRITSAFIMPMVIFADNTVAGYNFGKMEDFKELNIAKFGKIKKIVMHGYNMSSACVLFENGTVREFEQYMTIHKELVPLFVVPEDIQNRVLDICCVERYSLALLDNGEIMGWGYRNSDFGRKVPFQFDMSYFI